MKIIALLPVVAWLAIAVASPVPPPIETLNYSVFDDPPLYPPDGGCIIVARIYTKFGEYRVWDSAPICTPDAVDFPTATRDYVDHPPPGIKSGTYPWVAFGWIFPEDKSATNIGRPGCIWFGAHIDQPQ
jgi:hypothetical protein